MNKRNNTQIASTDNPLFSILIKSTENNIGETGATSLSDALKSNTTLTQLDLSREDKRNNTNGIHQQSTLSILNKSTENRIGEAGATSLSDALKSNTTLTKLDLRSENQKKHIDEIHQQSTLSFSSNQQGTALEKQEQRH